MWSPETAKSVQNDKTRNSPLRKVADNVITPVVEWLHKTYPDITADHLTILGTVGVAIGALLAERSHMVTDRETRNRLRGAASAAMALGSLMDAFDGGLARLQAREKPQPNSSRGQLLDVGNDRIQEMILGLVRMRVANRQERSGDKIAALLNTLTNIHPSLARAWTETQGGVVPEAGRNVFELLGTRAGRAAVNFATVLIPEVSGEISLQAVLDTVTTVANIVTTVNRYRLSQKDVPENSSQIQELAKARVRMLAGLTVIISGVSLICYRQMTGKLKQK